MAKTEMDLQKAAFKRKSAERSKKLTHAVFGHAAAHDAACYADGGLITGAAVPVAKAFGGRAAAIDAAEARALGPAQTVPSPVTAGTTGPSGLGNGLTAEQAEARYKQLVKPVPVAAAPVAAPSMLQRAKAAFGYSNGSPIVHGPGTGTSDSIPARLSKGEAVLPADTVRAVGPDKVKELIKKTHTPVKARFGHANGGILNPDGTVQGRAMSANEAAANAAVKQAGPEILEEATGSGQPAAQNTSKLGKAANSFRSMGGKVVDAGKSFIKNTAAGALAAGSIAGSADKIMTDASDPAARAAQQQSMGVETPFGSLVADAADAFAHTGNAITGGLAGKFGRSLSNYAGGGSFADDVPSTQHPAQSAQPQVPSTPNEAPGATLSKFYAENPDVRAAVVQAPRQDTEQHDLGDYGAPGTQIFGRSATPGGHINDFSGQGGGQPMAPSGVSFKYYQHGGMDGQGNGSSGAGGSFGAGGYPQAPSMVTSPAAKAAQDNIAKVAEQLAKTQPGKFDGKKSLTRKLAGLTEAASALQAPATAANAFSQQTYGHQVSQFGHTMGYNSQLATNELGRRQAELQYRTKSAEIHNEARKQNLAEYQQHRSNEMDGLKGLAGGDKDVENSINAFIGTATFPNARGEAVPLWQLDPKSKATAYGYVQKEVDNMKAAKGAGQPYSLGGGNQNTEPGFFGKAKVAIAHPWDAAWKGVTANANAPFTTARVNDLPSTQSYAARAADMKKDK